VLELYHNPSGPPLRPKDEPSSSTERDGCDDGIAAKLWLIIGVKPHAVRSRAILVEQRVIEMDAHSRNYGLAQLQECFRPRAWLERLPGVAVGQLA
jgi:hypothetical protein